MKSRRDRWPNNPHTISFRRTDAAIALQAIFDITGYLNTWWAKAGYTALTLMFTALTIVYSWAALDGMIAKSPWSRP